MLFSTNAPTYRFNTGILSSTLLARGDLKDYDAGLQVGSKNWALMIHGGMKRRPGTLYLDTVGEKMRLLPFRASNGQRFVIGLSHEKLTVYDTNGEVVQSITGCAWSASTMWQVRYTQRFDTAFLADNNGAYRLKKLVRASSGTWTLSDFTYETTKTTAGNNLKRTPFMKFAPASTTIQTGGVTAVGAVTLTLSAAWWVNAAAPFGHINTYIRHSGKQIYITSVTSSTVATGTIYEALPASAETSDWEEEAFTGLYGYETGACFHSSRFFMAGPAQSPTSLWGSKVAAFFNFDDGTGAPADSIWHSVIADGVTTIKHIVSGAHLQIYTDGGVGYAPEGLTTPLVPEDFDVRFRVPHAVGDVRPHQFDLASLYVSAGDDTSAAAVRGLLLSSDSNVGYEDEYTSQLAQEILNDPQDMDILHKSRDRAESYAFVVNGDGTLAVFLGARQEKVSGWMLWETGPGQGSGEDGEGEYYSVCAVDQDVFFIVYRNVAGTWDYRLEKMDWDCMLDCALVFEDAMQRQDWSGADLFAGGTVQAVASFYSAESGTVYEADNVYDISDIAVASADGTYLDGDFDTTYTTRKVTLGYGFYPIAIALPVEMSTQDYGTTMGRGRKTRSAHLHLRETRNCRIFGQRFRTLTAGYDPSLVPDAVTGWRQKWKLGWKKAYADDPVIIDQDANLPCEVLGMVRDTVF